ncbi:hypothetical protein [Variovorax sp. KBS0712]|uniref:hypothetical protein n=1 Tax=Variovorax sp. KBS0712 TaxID=2578111 RepID=UPI0021B1578A|nr:hypothetical protein [Variovorax sp. KBS0712]
MAELANGALTAAFSALTFAAGVAVGANQPSHSNERDVLIAELNHAGHIGKGLPPLRTRDRKEQGKRMNWWFFPGLRALRQFIPGETYWIHSALFCIHKADASFSISHHLYAHMTL